MMYDVIDGVGEDENGKFFACPEVTCTAKSYHPEDVRQGYCSRCNWWTGESRLRHAKPSAP